MIDTLTSVLTDDTLRTEQALTEHTIAHTSAGVPWIDEATDL